MKALAGIDDPRCADALKKMLADSHPYGVFIDCECCVEKPDHIPLSDSMPLLQRESGPGRRALHLQIVLADGGIHSEAIL